MLVYQFHIGFLNFGSIDVLDIGLVSLLLYQSYRLVRGSVAARILIGFIFIYLFYLVINAFGMALLSAILGQFIGVGVLAAIILFQKEIRKFLMMIGNTTQLDGGSWLRIFKPTNEETFVDVNAIVKAAQEMSKTFTGALIVLEKKSNLDEFIETGDEIDAVLSKRLLITIFNKTSPMHDGAVVIKNGRVRAARCIIPVSENQFLPANYGLRHRAAIGLSEVNDAIVLVVSEETGKMSIVHHGEIEYAVDGPAARSQLVRLLNANEGKEEKS